MQSHVARGGNHLDSRRSSPLEFSSCWPRFPSLQVSVSPHRAVTNYRAGLWFRTLRRRALSMLVLLCKISCGVGSGGNGQLRRPSLEQSPRLSFHCKGVFGAKTPCKSSSLQHPGVDYELRCDHAGECRFVSAVHPELNLRPQCTLAASFVFSSTSPDLILGSLSDHSLSDIL